jgi:hypothetical protein
MDIEFTDGSDQNKSLFAMEDGAYVRREARSVS